MRIIAGSLGGRQFASPHGNRTHPMSDKVRGALFNALGDISGLRVLDAFAGTGALSYEAISRGAADAVAIDNDKHAQRTLTENVRNLGLQKQVQVIKASAAAWLSTTDEYFDIVFCDPPYDDLQVSSMQKLAEQVKKDGLLVLSLPPGHEYAFGDAFEHVQTKHYGDATLVFYRRIQ
jgi:16S rRNA (guanine966-N2)-methyltransferase